MLEEGYYPGRAREWGLGETSNGNPQVAVLCDVYSDDGRVLGQRTWYGGFGEKQIEHTIKGLRAFGWEGDDLTDLRGLDKNEVQLVIQHEEYNGKTTDKIRWVNKPATLALKTPLQGGKLKSFAAQMRGQIRALDAAEGRLPKSPPTMREEQSASDEDILF